MRSDRERSSRVDGVRVAIGGRGNRDEDVFRRKEGRGEGDRFLARGGSKYFKFIRCWELSGAVGGSMRLRNPGVRVVEAEAGTS